MVYTPINENEERLEFQDKDVKFSEDYEEGRYLGFKGHVTIKGKKYKVYGMSCGISGCNCDEMIKEANPNG